MDSAERRLWIAGTRLAVGVTGTLGIQPLFDLILEDDRTNVYEGELKARPPPAPTGERKVVVRAGRSTDGVHCAEAGRRLGRSTG